MFFYGNARNPAPVRSLQKGPGHFGFSGAIQILLVFVVLGGVLGQVKQTVRINWRFFFNLNVICG